MASSFFLRQPELSFENSMASLYAHPGGYVLLRYRPGPRTLDDVQQVLIHTGQLLTQRGWTKFLSDQRLLPPFTDEEQALILHYWQARQVTAGTTGAVLLS